MTEKSFVKCLEKSFVSEDFLTKKEVGVGYGVADMVLIKKNSISAEKCKKRLSYGQIFPLKNDCYFKILHHIPDHEGGSPPVSLDFLVNKTHFTKAFIKYNVLRRLEEKKYIRRENKNLFIKINGWLPIASDIIAIEAKIKDWRRGFLQANRYKLFADQVYLAMPVDKIHSVDLELLKRHNVGLLSFDISTGKKNIIIRPHKNKPGDLYKKNQAFEFFWGREFIKKLLPS